jgi:hypothetical protein
MTVVLTTHVACGQEAMFDPVIDRPEEEWCYAAQSTTVIGLPYVSEPVQVTFDGAIYTRFAELAFFYGDTLQPVMARHKTFLEGWIPIVGYEWKDQGIDYELEIFSAELGETGRANLVQFARLTMTNPGTISAEGVMAAGVRGSAGHFRLGRPREPVIPSTGFDMDGSCLRRNGKLVYTFSPGAEKCAVPDEPYQQEYQAADYYITDRSVTGLSVYRRVLKPQETFSAFFKMPRIPLEASEQIAGLRSAGYAEQRQQTIRFWRNLFGDFEFVIPEKRVNDSYRAALVHLILATRIQNGQKRQGSGLPYDALFLNDYMDMLLAYETAGLGEFVKPNVAWLLRKQHASGMFIDVHNRGNDDIVTSHGQGLFSLAYHFVMTRDLDYGRKVYPAIRKGVALIIHDHKTDKHGLLRPSIPYDAPMLTGYHTCHNLFGLLALRASIRVAKMLGETQDAQAWTRAQNTYRESILKAIDWVYEKEGYIRSGLYDWQAGKVQGHGPANDFPNQDWENNLLVYPTELLQPYDPRLIDTLATIRARKYREGCMSYRNGMHVHQYVTLNQANQYRAIGDAKHALLDLYHVLLHNGSTHEGFENLVEPWTNRTPSASCPPPHAWAAAKTALFIRNMMVCEYGGQAGIDMAARDLYLYPLISPAWIKPGKKIEIKNAPTEMGRISSTLRFVAHGAEVTVAADFHRAPRYIVLRVPYCVELASFRSNATRAFQMAGLIWFTPDVTELSIKWCTKPEAHDHNFQDILKSYRREYNFIVKDANYDPSRAGKAFLLADERDHPAEALSFDLVKRAFLKEYTRRFEASVHKGEKPYPVAPPRLWSKTERKDAFSRTFHALSLSTGKPASCSSFLPGYPAALANDGLASDKRRFWATDVKQHPGDAWWQVDLQKPSKVNRVVVIGVYGDKRYYGFTVETSLDGNTWSMAADRRDNRAPSTAQGYDCRFEARSVRYIRLTLTHHSINTGRHLVEVMAYGD